MCGSPGATEMLLNNPTEVLGSIGGTVVGLDMLQQETSVWDFLLGLPDLFLKPTDEEILNAGAEELEDLKKWGLLLTVAYIHYHSYIRV